MDVDEEEKDGQKAQKVSRGKRSGTEKRADKRKMIMKCLSIEFKDIRDVSLLTETLFHLTHCFATYETTTQFHRK